MKDHTLMQAFSRTNRIFNDKKEFGNIVSFFSLKDNLDEALKLFGDDGGTIAILRSFNDYYLGYKDNYMYYTEQYEPNNIYKVNLGTLQNETIFSIPSEDGYLDKRIYLSDDMKYVFITQNKYVQSDVKVLLQLYELNTGSLVAKHVLPFEEYANIDNAFFVKDGIIFTKLYEMYKWNYLKNKGE